MDSFATENPRAVMGANNPPEPTLVERFADTTSDVDSLAARATALPLTVEDQETAEKYVAVIKDAKAKADAVDVTRLATTKPLRDEVADINLFFSKFGTRLGRVVSVLSERLEAFYEAQRRAERDRLAAEAAERQRQADEERARLDEAQAAGGIEAEMAEERQKRLDNAARAAEARALKDAGRVRTGGGTIGARKGFDFRVKDYAAVDLSELKESFGVDAVDKAIRDHVRRHKNTRPLKGVDIFETSKLNIR